MRTAARCPLRRCRCVAFSDRDRIRRRSIAPTDRGDPRRDGGHPARREVSPELANISDGNFSEYPGPCSVGERKTLALLTVYYNIKIFIEQRSRFLKIFFSSKFPRDSKILRHLCNYARIRFTAVVFVKIYSFSFFSPFLVFYLSRPSLPLYAPLPPLVVFPIFFAAATEQMSSIAARGVVQRRVSNVFRRKLRPIAAFSFSSLAG